jgi:hypothetical protein
MLLIRAIFFSLIGVAALIIWVSITISTTAPDFNKIREFTKTNCTVVKKVTERDGDNYRFTINLNLTEQGLEESWR